MNAPSRAVPRWPGWQHLPREARDTLFLLGVIGWTVLPHTANVPWWCSVLTALVLVWRARLAVTNAPLPGRWTLTGVLVVASLLTWVSHGTVLGKVPGITMAVVLMALKTLELRARRDAFVVFFLGFFLVLTHFLFSQSLLVAVAMLGSVWGLLTALVLAHMPVGQPSLRLAGRLALRTALLGAPLMALLFVLFPRIGPMWGTPADSLAATGLSNAMRMGSVAEIAVNDAIAMRIRFEGTPPPAEAMYFRGPVLSLYTGREWQPGLSQVQPRGELQVSGPAVRYEVTLEPQNIATIPLLDVTPEAPAIDGLRLRQRDDLAWVAHRPVTERLRFTVASHPRFSYASASPSRMPREYLQLPSGYSPRTLAWAAQLRARLPGADARTLADAVFLHIRRGGYIYTLAPGTYGEADPTAALDEFWLDRKEGFCEHFAAAFAVTMRAMGVPTRVVTGYQGADLEVIDGFHIVRQNAAHAWVEYWQDGAGWVRADPTAAVAPERVSRAQNLRPPPGFIAGAIGNVDPRLLAQFRTAWETVNNRWNQWVLNYSRGEQLALLKRWGYDTPSWEDLALLLVAGLSTLALGGAAWAWFDRHRQDPWQRQSQAVRRGLRRLGVDAPAHAPPRRLASAVRERFGTPGETLAALLDGLDRQRYGRDALRRPSRAWRRDVNAQLRRLRAMGAGQ